VLEAQIKRRLAMKKVGIVGAKQSRDFSQPKLTIGLDLGERSSWYCMLDEAGAIVLEQKLGTSPKAMKKVFGTIPSSRIALDAAEHGGRIEADQQKSGDLPSIHRIGNHGLAQTQVFFLPLNRRLQAGWNSCVRVSFDPVSTNLGLFLRSFQSKTMRLVSCSGMWQSIQLLVA
jgi:hypothetical protein